MENHPDDPLWLLVARFVKTIPEGAAAGTYPKDIFLARTAFQSFVEIHGTDQFGYLLPILSAHQRISAILLSYWLKSLSILGALESLLDSFQYLHEQTFLGRDWDRFPGKIYHEELRDLCRREFFLGQGAPKTERSGFSLAQRTNLCEMRAQSLACTWAYELSLTHADISVVRSPPKQRLLGELKEQLRLAHKNVTSPILDVCAWIDKTNLVHKPRYLWDVYKRCLIETNGQEFRYTAISHTWGRARVFGECASVCGLPQGWLVPRNTWFSVETLPQLLSQLPGHPRHIWLDLLCIPQNEDFLCSTIRSEEISRQASIFHNAFNTVVWFHEVEHWRKLESVITLACTLMLSSPYLDFEPSSDHLKSLENSMSELYNPITGEISAWFTSLWTLQELYLRPGMVICDKNFRTCYNMGQGGSAEGTLPITLVDLAAIPIAFRHKEKRLSSLDDITIYGNVDNIFFMSRRMLLNQAIQRKYTCKSPVEAIMSAAGATDWYTEGADELAESLVGGRYPAAFVEELRTKMGHGLFFTMESKYLFSSQDFGRESTRFIHGCQHCLGPSEKPSESLGTLLPFCKDMDYDPQSRESVEVQYEDLRTLKQWQILACGAVRVRKAVIFGSTASLPEYPLSCLFNVIEAEQFYDSQNSDDQDDRHDLRTWLEGYMPERQNYAVAVRRGPGGWEGAVLKETREGVLIKVGWFRRLKVTDRHTSIKPTAVDWTIL